MATEPLTEIIKRLPTFEEPPRPPRNAPKTSNYDAQLMRQGFPRRHLVNFGGSGHAGWNAALNRVADMLASLNGSLIVLWGARGTGKTQIAVDAAHVVEPPHVAIYRKASEIFRELRATFRTNATTSEADVFTRSSKAFLLIIDEAQERGETDFEDRSLTQIVDARYDAMLHTIIISNLQKKDLAVSLGSSIVSRAQEIGEVIECNWPSFREQPKSR